MTSLGRRIALAAVAGLAIVLALAAACSGPGGGASASDVSGCAAVLPLARSIVHDRGTLTYIRRINHAEADALARKLGVTPTAPPHPHTGHRERHRPARTRIRQPQTCLIVYHGSYPRGTITSASPPAVAGHYALIVLRVRHPSIDRILVTDRLPSGLKPHVIHF